MSINYLVTGGYGFLGKHLVKLLLSKPTTRMVRVVDLAIPHSLHNQSQILWKNKKLPDPPVHYCRLDICNTIHMTHAMVDIHVVFHIAAKVELGVTHPADYGPFYMINVQGTKTILDCCLKMSVTKFILVSSVSVIMDSDSPKQHMTEKEKYPSRHVDHYAYTKCLSECDTLDYNNRPCAFSKPPHTSIALSDDPAKLPIISDPLPEGWPRLACVVIRPGVIFGAGAGGFEMGFRKGGLHALSLTESSKTSSIPQSSLSTRYSCMHSKKRKTSLIDFVYVENVCEALILASDKLIRAPSTVAGQVFHITNMDPWSIGEFWTHGRLLYQKKRIVKGMASSPLDNKNVIKILPRWIISFIIWILFGFYTIMRYSQGMWARMHHPVHENGRFWNPLKDMPKPWVNIPLSPAMIQWFTTTYTLDCTKAQKELGYVPKYSMLEGMYRWIQTIHATETLEKQNLIRNDPLLMATSPLMASSSSSSSIQGFGPDM